MDGFLKKRQFFKRGFQENYLFCEKKESNIQKNTKQCKKVTVKNIIVGNNFGKTSGERELDRGGGGECQNTTYSYIHTMWADDGAAVYNRVNLRLVHGREGFSWGNFINQNCSGGE